MPRGMKGNGWGQLSGGNFRRVHGGNSETRVISCVSGSVPGALPSWAERNMRSQRTLCLTAGLGIRTQNLSFTNFFGGPLKPEFQVADACRNLLQELYIYTLPDVKHLSRHLTRNCPKVCSKV